MKTISQKTKKRSPFQFWIDREREIGENGRGLLREGKVLS